LDQFHILSLPAYPKMRGWRKHFPKGIRRIQVSGGALYLIPEDCAHRSSGWQRIPLEGRQLTQLLRARAHLVTPIYEWNPH
jgi:hypothetical protein